MKKLLPVYILLAAALALVHGCATGLGPRPTPGVRESGFGTARSVASSQAGVDQERVELAHAALTAVGSSPALRLFSEGILERSGIQLMSDPTFALDARDRIVLFEAKDALRVQQALGRKAMNIPSGAELGYAEGYQIWVENSGDQHLVFVMGNDSRGLLYGAGKLLRELRYAVGSIKLDGSLRMASHPEHSIRGVQMGYNSTNNTTDNWDLRQYESFLRDIIIFGANALEINSGTPPYSDTGPLMKVPAAQMRENLCELVDGYGLELWIWYPILAKDADRPEVQQNILEEFKNVFRHCKKITGLFIPAGDPGSVPVRTMLSLLPKIAKALHEFHPDAGLWFSPQGYYPEALQYFYRFLREQKPDWLKGVVYGPWVQSTLKNFRSAIPEKYPIRNYPDISHSVRSQFPFPDWDPAFAMTEGRETINPAPQHQWRIHRSQERFVTGSISYSEGVHDDLNKFIWLELDWSSHQDVGTIVREYANAFLSSLDSQQVAQGLVELEQNWTGPILANTQISQTLHDWKTLEREFGSKSFGQWRLELYLFRAYYDAYVQERAKHDHAVQMQVDEILKASRSLGAPQAAAAAAERYLRDGALRSEQELRDEIEKLGELLNRHIGIQLSVARQGADGAERGAVLDSLDQSLNEQPWLLPALQRISKIADGAEAQRQLDAIMNWEDPGPGGFYDDLGNAAKQPHLVKSETAPIDDPGFVESVQNEVSWKDQGRLSWQTQAETLFDTPLTMRYEGLDPHVQYQIAVVYHGRFHSRMHLTANGRWIIHGDLDSPSEPQVLTFDIPPEATQGGRLELTWQRSQDPADRSRGCQVAEVWLRKKR